MTPQAKITGWSALLQTEYGPMVLTMRAKSREGAAAAFATWRKCRLEPDEVHRTVTVLAQDFGSPLAWTQTEMELERCKPCE